MPERGFWVSACVAGKHPGNAKDTVCHRNEARGLPAHRISRPWEVKRSDIDEWMCASGADGHIGRDATGRGRKR